MADPTGYKSAFNGMSFGSLIIDRIKKMMLDMTSIKFQTLVFVAIGMYYGRIEEVYGLAYFAAVLGIKEFGDIKTRTINMYQDVKQFTHVGRYGNGGENPGA